MYDKNDTRGLPLGQQIRSLRKRRGLTLAALAERAGTSAPTLHRYESGWDRFEIQTLRRIAAALDASLEVRLVPAAGATARAARPSARALTRSIRPLFWDHDLGESDLVEHRDWVLARVLTEGSLEQVRAARAFFGDDAVLLAARRRGVDARTRTYWETVLEGGRRASQGSGR
jgi:transcriptional regulator with XRE-family HTH domain